ncbi:hypothetical protein DTO027B5_5813 [Paecilomyces variotii]|nr:hypothetical protein DTO169C6_1342 [Paecilomyces variotii]KAJ9266591.1 hypothetical protein DTO195F2_1114 [Paecilomyces variotii]KAJ9329173.1 hypothetical protein DTO027B3_573 [Paecilomyces variotii]KAJ9332339.1 hypothetical protein DTO027B5_5813 [Paecilomyces variotii]
MDRIAILERLLLEEQRRREEAEGRALDEQHRREEAEEVAKASRPQTLKAYLEACHALSLAIKVVTARSLTTQGDTTSPTGRVYPRRLIPWDEFPTRQEEIWDKLSEPSFIDQHQFPSQHQLDYVQSLIGPISSEHGLRHFERDTVENAVQKLVDAVYENPLLRNSLDLRGTVTFESHTNLGQSENISESLGHMSLTDNDLGGAPPAPTTPARRAPRKTKGKGNRADQFCIYRMSDGASVPTMAIEYKAPHKLSQDEVVTGLASEIHPERDVINREGEGFQFASRALATAVVTQLFSYMIGKGIQYGYICTGQVFIFLYIPDDPATVYYHVCVPNLDVLDDDENRLHRTAVAQVFAFILQALRAAPPPLSWHDAADGLDTWVVEYDDVLSKIPETVRKGKEPRASPYKPQRWKGFKRSPIQTRSRCTTSDAQPIRRGNSDDDDNDDEVTGPPSPTPCRLSRSGKKASASTTSGGRRGRGDRRGRQGESTQGRIQDRPYCSHQCLLGLAHGGPMDKNCPNIHSHGLRHIGRTKFLHLLREQLAVDRGHDADSMPLSLSGSVGSLFKVRLSAFGYTLVAKGVETDHVARLRHEEKVYDQLRIIQGKYVPVCLGMIDLVLPYYFDGGVFEHFLLLSWAGRPLPWCVGDVKTPVIPGITTGYNELHRLRVLHNDAEARNILYDGSPMIVDFERAKICCRQPLGLTSPNGQSRKRKQGKSGDRGADEFARELESISGWICSWGLRESRRDATVAAPAAETRTP